MTNSSSPSNAQTTFESLIISNPDIPLPLLVMKTFLSIVSENTSDHVTHSGMNSTIQSIIASLKSMKNHQVSIIAGTTTFLNFVNSFEDRGSDYKALLLEAGQALLEKYQGYRDIAASNGIKFIRDDVTVLVHSYSSVVIKLLEKASQTTRFRVIVTESRPSGSGFKAITRLRSSGIPCSLISDTAVGYIIDSIDLVLVGCEGLAKNGGIMNQIGTYQIAVVAKAANKPFYVACESYKYVEIFPLNQGDLPTNVDLEFDNATAGNGKEMQVSNPVIDYTPPGYISLIFTDEGVFTPSGVAEQLLSKNSIQLGYSMG